MGGKQKRAAKYKKWIESQNRLKLGGGEMCVDSGDKTDSGDSRDGSGGECCSSSPIPEKVRYEVLKHRQKRRRVKSYGGNWLFNSADRINKIVGGWPGWPNTVVLMLLMYIAMFFAIRFLIAIFSPAGPNVDRAALYNGIKSVAPGPVYKFIRVVDYLFTSRELSMDGIYEILLPDLYYSHSFPQQRHYDMDP